MSAAIEEKAAEVPEIQIDPEIKALIPPLREEELAQLEANLKAEGCRDPLVVWKGHGILLDGHNRFAACQRLGIGFRTVEVDLPDKEAACDWVDANQLGRRNLTPDQAALICGRRYNRAKKTAVTAEGVSDNPGGLSNACGGQNVHHGKTAERLAKAHGVNERTIRRDAQFAEAVDVVQAIMPDLPKQILAGNAPPKSAVILAARILQDSPSHANAILEGKATVSEYARKEKQRLREQAVADAAKTSPLHARVWQASWEAWLPSQPDCDLLLTDPLYSTDVADIEAFAKQWLPAALAKVKPTGRAYVCIGAYPDELAAYLNAPWRDSSLRLRNVLVWTYRNTLGPQPTHDYKLNWQAILHFVGKDAPPLQCPLMVEQFAVQDINTPDGRQGERYHPWQKPDELAKRLIRHSTQPGQLVLDPFCGTGTFVLAAARLGRQGLGCDIDKDILDIAEERGCELGAQIVSSAETNLN